jgi:hydrogenase nickel incorporation protein HypA/HybF
MHELSIAQDIIEIIHQYVPPADRHRVRSVCTIVGEHSGVVPDSLMFSYQVITASTPLQHSRLEIEHVPFVVRCNRCNAESQTEWGSIRCPSCGSLDSTAIAGTELRVREIELDDQMKESL